MNTKYVAIILALLLIGFLGNSAVDAYNEHTVRNRGYEMQDRMMDMAPKVLEIDGQEVLYLPDINYVQHQY